MKPKVSVVIPTYNSAKFIPDTLDSVFCQTYEDYEVVVIDDGSTDNTSDILQPYMSRIRYIQKENGGPASARSMGVEVARGEYIAFLDSDDIWLPEKLEKQMECFQFDQDIGLLYSNCIRFGEDDFQSSTTSDQEPLKGYVFYELLEGFVFPTSTVVAKKKCFDEKGLFDSDLDGSEDYDMWLRIAQSFKVDYIPVPLVKYRVRGEGHSRSNINRAYESLIKTIDKAMESIEDSSFDKDAFYRKRLLRLHNNWGLSLFNSSDFRGARGHFAEVIKRGVRSPGIITYYLGTFVPYSGIKILRNIKQHIA